MFKKSATLIATFTILSTGAFAGATKKVGADQPGSVRMAESIMARHPGGYGGWDYVTCTVLRGFEELWRKTGNPRYYDYIKQTVDLAVRSNGTISGYRVSEYNIDEINEGRMVLLVYKETGEEKYRQAAQLVRSQLDTHPRTSEGGFWHKQVYPHQMWLDGLYMGSPFYAEYSKIFDDTDGFDDVVNQLVLMETHARDSVSGLLYHGWDESKTQDWADPETGVSKSFWGRAVGWYAMAAVDVLDFLPENYAGRDSVVAILQRLAAAVTAVQDDSTGLWWQVLDQGGREGNYLESSVSCMLVYMLAKASRLGYIDAAYREVAEKGYQGILDEFISENSDGTINLDQTCVTAGLGNGRDGTYDYYVYGTSIRSNDGKGLGPFITASVELEPVQQAEMVAYWPLDEQSGTNAADATSNGNDGALVNMSATAWTTGVVGNALQFDGIDDYVLVPHDPAFDFDSGSFSLSFWVKQSVQDRHMRYLIKGTHATPGSGKRYEVFHHANNEVRFTIDDNVTKSAVVVPNTAFVTGDWVFVTAVRNTAAQELQLYANAQLVGSVADNTGDISEDEDLYLGVSSDEDETNLEGLLDDVRIYNYALSTSEISALYQDGITSVEGPPEPEVFQLSVSNYPNPFNPATKISYSLPERTRVQISLHNLRGQKVATLLDAVESAGRHTLNFNASNLSNGIYFCRVVTASAARSHKMIYLK